MEKNLESFFNAKSIAILEATGEEDNLGNILIKKLKRLKGKIIPISKEEKIHKKKCYKKLKDYEKNIDLAVIVDESKKISKHLDECSKKGIKNVIIFSDPETKRDKAKIEKRIQKLSKKNKMNILGPNSSGIINPKKNMNLTPLIEKAKKGNHVFITQSRSIGNYILDLDLGMRSFISLGDSNNLDVSDWINYLSKDKKIKRIICYIEKIKEGKKFIEEAKNSNKEIVIIKPKNILDQTKDRIYDGAFRQAGIKRSTYLTRPFGIREDNLAYKLKGEKIKVISNSRGAAILIRDKLKREGILDTKITLLSRNAKENLFKRELNKIDKQYDTIIIAIAPSERIVPEKIAVDIVHSKYKHKIVACLLGDKSFTEAKEILEKNQVSHLTKAI